MRQSNKKLISVRLSEDLLLKIDNHRNNINSKSLWCRDNSGRKYYCSSLGGYCSRADVIERALDEYFFKTSAPGR